MLRFCAPSRAIVAVLLVLTAAAPLHAAQFVVNSAGDTHDLLPGDGLCSAIINLQ